MLWIIKTVLGVGLRVKLWVLLWLVVCLLVTITVGRRDIRCKLM